jgi:nucleotide-binding universal stress UspA family protein
LAFSTLLAYLRIDHRNTDLLRVVSAAAQRFGSSVIGIVAKQASAHLASRGAGPFEPHQHDLHMFRERAAAAEREFRAALSKVPNLDWRSSLTLGPACEHVANEARSADLVVLPAVRHDRLHLPSGEADVGDLIMRLGRPALVAPPGVTGLELNQVLVCWKDSRETRRAVADALPMLKASRRVNLVELVEAEGVDHSRRRLEEVAQWLSRNGVESNSSSEVANGSEALQLAAIAKDLRADLIVAGAFGHSRMREWAFGGVTRDLLLCADRCILASH